MQGRRWIILAGVVLGRVAFGLQLQAVASLGPDLVAAFHLDYAALGTLIGLYMLPGAFVAIPGGMLGRRFGDRVVLGAGFALMTAGSLGCGLAPGPATLGAARVVAGTRGRDPRRDDGQGGRRRLLRRRVRASRWGWWSAVSRSGSGCASCSPRRSRPHFGWHGDFLAGAVVAAAALACFLLGEPAGRRRVLPGTALFPSRRECLLVFLAGAVWTTYNAGYFGFLSYLPSLMAARGHGVALTGAVMAIATWGNIPLILLGGAIAARMGNMRVFTVGMLALVAGLAGLGVSDHPIAWAILFGTIGSVQPSVIVAAGTLSARPENRAIGMGIFYTVYYIGGTVLPGLFGHAADRAGSPAGAFLAAAAVALLAVPLFALHQHLAARGRAAAA